MALLKMKRDGKTVAVRLDREAVIVGSGPACNIKVPEGGLAQRHAQILRMNNGFILRDLSGDVGTFVNGKKVKEHLLSDRDVIQMGQERFTYAEQEGEATARVAVSAAPPPTTRMAPVQPPTQRAVAAAPPAAAPKGQTARMVAVDPNRKTSTRAMPPAAAPAAEAPAPSGKNTARMQKSGGTQRLAASTTRKMSSRTTGRITKSTETFSMPKTRKGKIIAACVALGLLGVGGIMVVALMGQDKPEEIKADLKSRLENLNKMLDNPVKRDEEAADILANDKFKKYGAEMYRGLFKQKDAIHQKAVEQKLADSEVTPFFQKYNTAKGDPEKMKTDADGLYDEAKSLADKYAPTNYADKLRTIRDELKTALEARKSALDYTIALVTLKREVEAALKEGQCKEAAKKVDEFGVKFNEKEVAELFNQLKDVRERIKRGAEEFVKKKNTEAQNLVKDGKKADAVKLLEGCRPGLEGYTAALEKLEAAIKAVKG